MIASPARRPPNGALRSRHPIPQELDERTERLVERIAAVPINQLIMVKLAMNTALLQQGIATSRMVSTVFDGIARHTPEGHAFVAQCARTRVPRGGPPA